MVDDRAHRGTSSSTDGESREARNYLVALEAHKPKRGRKRTAARIEVRLHQIEVRLASAGPLARVNLTQERTEPEVGASGPMAARRTWHRWRRGSSRRGMG